MPFKHDLALQNIYVSYQNEAVGVKGPPFVGEEVRKKDVGKVGS
jgi:hypothetical protein